MILGTATINGTKAVIIPKDEYNELKAHAGKAGQLPALPPANANGNYPAIETMQVIMAHSIIKGRKQMGITQAQLAKLAGVRQETISRLESGKFNYHRATLKKVIDVIDPKKP